MERTIQIRHVPDRLHRKLKARAATLGLSLSDYLVREVEKIAEQPTLEEMLDRLSRLPPVTTTQSTAQIIRKDRDRR